MSPAGVYVLGYRALGSLTHCGGPLRPAPRARPPLPGRLRLRLCPAGCVARFREAWLTGPAPPPPPPRPPPGLRSPGASAPSHLPRCRGLGPWCPAPGPCSRALKGPASRLAWWCFRSESSWIPPKACVPSGGLAGFPLASTSGHGGRHQHAARRASGLADRELGSAPQTSGH